MDLSNLDCPQYVKFPIEDFEMSYNEDSIKHEDSCTDVNIPNDEEESYIFIEDSSHTENSISESEEYSERKSEINSEYVEDEEVQENISDQFITAIGSFLEENSCTEGGTAAHVKLEASPEQVNNEKIESAASDQIDSILDMHSNSCQENSVLLHTKSDNHSEHIIDENIEREISDHVDESSSNRNSCAGDDIFACLKSEANSEVINEEIERIVSVLTNNMLDMCSESNPCLENILEDQIKSEANSEKPINEKIESIVSDLTNNMIDMCSESNPCLENILAVQFKSDVHSQLSRNGNVESEVFDHIDEPCSKVKSSAENDILVCVRSEANSEQSSNEKIESMVFDLSNNMLDMCSESNPCPEDIFAVHVKSDIYSEYIRDEHVESEVFDHLDEPCSKAKSFVGNDILVCERSKSNSEQASNGKIKSIVSNLTNNILDMCSKLNPGLEDSFAVPIKSEDHSENIIDQNMESGFFEHLDDSGSKPNSCTGDHILTCAKSDIHSEHVRAMSSAGDDILVCVRSEANSEKPINEKIESIVSDLTNNMLDMCSESNPCLENILAVQVKSEVHSEHITDENMESDIFNHFDECSSKENSLAGNDILVFVNSDGHSEDFTDDNMGSEISDHLDELSSKASSCADNDILVCVDSEKDDMKTVKRNELIAQKNKVSSVSKAAASKTKLPPYVPLAQQVAAFQQKCPERYLSVHRKEFQSSKHWAPPKYIPKSPKLQAAKRHREIKNNSEDVKRYEFHARPLNPKIFEKPVVLETEKQSTQPKGFALKTAQRAEAHVKYEKVEEKNEFHARPVPKSCHIKTSEPEKVKVHATKPKSPNFALKTREEKWSQRCNKANDDASSMQTKHSNNKTSQKQPKQIDLSQSVLKHEKKQISILPFSFEEREKAKLALKQQKSQDMEKENTKPGFKARGMPIFKAPALPSIQRKPTTQPEPFTFLSETRISGQTKCDTTIADKTDSKTVPENVLKTFNPKKVQTIVQKKGFQFQTEKRAAQWKQLEDIRKAEEIQKQLALEAYKAAQESREQLEIMEMRQKAVHKANPIRVYKSVEIKPCNLVTQPFTPKFETDKRLQSRLDKTEIQF